MCFNASISNYIYFLIFLDKKKENFKLYGTEI